jgi:hypothetical protein
MSDLSDIKEVAEMTDDELADVLEMAEALKDDYSRTQFSTWDPKTKPKLVDALLLQTKRLVASLKRCEELEKDSERYHVVEKITSGHKYKIAPLVDVFVVLRDLNVVYRADTFDQAVDFIKQDQAAGSLPKGGDNASL